MPSQRSARSTTGAQKAPPSRLRPCRAACLLEHLHQLLISQRLLLLLLLRRGRWPRHGLPAGPCSLGRWRWRCCCLRVAGAVQVGSGAVLAPSCYLTHMRSAEHSPLNSVGLSAVRSTKCSTPQHSRTTPSPPPSPATPAPRLLLGLLLRILLDALQLRKLGHNHLGRLVVLHLWPAGRGGAA